VSIENKNILQGLLTNLALDSLRKSGGYLGASGMEAELKHKAENPDI